MIRVSFALAIATAAAFAACTPSRRAEAPPPPVDPTRMRHDSHTHLPCETCHRGSPAQLKMDRPGLADHQPCDQERCHKTEFLTTPGPLCLTCHIKIAPTGSPSIEAPLKRYPVEDAWQSMPPQFSHARHMNAAAMEKRVGFHVTCADCHVRSDQQLVRANHAICARCHAAEVALEKAPRMEDCGGCHRGAPRPRVRTRVRRGDVKFDHERHRTDRKGREIRCDACHTRTTRSTDYSDHGAPRVESCVACHDDADRVPYPMRMRICETCHRDKTASVVALAPRDHLSATERPLDHTLAFRRDHAESARRQATRCATCHIQMSGNANQACDECHQRMVPADHRITFREEDHGSDAIADRARCATCHVVEFCTACHSQRPRSHGIARDFVRQHGQLARINVRACISCHQQRFCAQSGCHGNEPGPVLP